MTEILFVDDEPFILNAIRRSMRKEKARWRTTFAGGGAEAINLIKQQAYDVLVTDMKMPGTDGLKVLTVAESCRPSMKRIALSGYSENELYAKANQLAHRFLNKPCSGAELKAAIEAVVSLNIEAA